MATDEPTVHALGERDLACGLELLIGPDPRAAIVSRVFYDLSDMTMLARKRPLASAFAGCAALLGIVAFVVQD